MLNQNKKNSGNLEVSLISGKIQSKLMVRQKTTNTFYSQYYHVSRNTVQTFRGQSVSKSDQNPRLLKKTRDEERHNLVHTRTTYDPGYLCYQAPLLLPSLLSLSQFAAAAPVQHFSKAESWVCTKFQPNLL